MRRLRRILQLPRWCLGSFCRRFFLGRPDPRGIRPKPFQIVFRTNLNELDVDHDIEIVDHNPAGRECPVDGVGADIVFIPQFLGDFLQDGAEMRFAGSGHDDKIVSD